MNVKLRFIPKNRPVEVTQVYLRAGPSEIEPWREPDTPGLILPHTFHRAEVHSISFPLPWQYFNNKKTAMRFIAVARSQRFFTEEREVLLDPSPTARPNNA